MQITHEEAQTLIQFSLDAMLNLQEKAILSAHLQGCAKCRAYAEDIKEVENILLPVMKRQWNLQPIPLSTHALTTKKSSVTQTRIILVTRMAIISMMLFAFIVSAWQFTVSKKQISGGTLASILPVPTPSNPPTNTQVNLQNCEEVLYHVQQNDTLQSIAARFSISIEQIMTINSLKTERVYPSMTLALPICEFTPTGTVNPMTLTTTYTPIKHAITSTPSG